MKIIKIIVGLLFDDKTLAGIVLLAMVIAAIFGKYDYKTAGAIVIWLGLISALVLSVQFELRRKLNSKK